jgi:hypothetical protein
VNPRTSGYSLFADRRYPQYGYAAIQISPRYRQRKFRQLLATDAISRSSERRLSHRHKRMNNNRIIIGGYTADMLNEYHFCDGAPSKCAGFGGFHMDEAGPGPDDEHVSNDDDGKPNETGLTLEAYALGLALPLDWLKTVGLATIDNPWTAGRSAVAISYRQRDGVLFRSHIR